MHIIVGLDVGGAELMLKRLVLHSQKNNKFQHSVISLMGIGTIGPILQDQGIMVYSLGMNSAASLPKTFLRLRALLKDIQPSVVQTWMYHADFLGGLAAKSLNIERIIWGIRTTDVSQGSSKVTVHLSKLCAKLSYYVPSSIVSVAHASKQYHVNIGYDEAKMRVIHNGYDLEALYSTKEDGLEVREQVNLSHDDIVIGSIGRFHSEKNQKLFVDVAAILVKKNPDLNLKFMMVGKDNDAENKELISWIKEYNLSDNFRLLGQRDDVPKCLQAMNILCLHSKTEGFPNVLVEAMILKTFVVSTDVGEVSNLIPSDQITSLDKVDYSKKLQEFLDSGYFLNEENLNSLKECSIAKYSISNIVLQYEDMYEKS